MTPTNPDDDEYEPPTLREVAQYGDYCYRRGLADGFQDPQRGRDYDNGFQHGHRIGIDEGYEAGLKAAELTNSLDDIDTIPDNWQPRHHQERPQQ